MTTQSPDLQLAHLRARAQEIYPDHTYKASMLFMDSHFEKVEEKVEWLKAGVAEFEGGMA